MTDTPRTDATAALHLQGVRWVYIYFAQELERELAAAKAELAKANAERDEARREVCQWAGCGFDGAKNAAKMRGWDCFKEVKP